MLKATEAALHASIAHWEENAAAESLGDASVDADDCALCARFFEAPDAYRCVRTSKSGKKEKCPVFARTGQTLCDGSPYREAWDAYDSENLKAFHKAARDEVAFLKSLLEPVK